MEQDILKKLEEQDKKLEDIYRSVEKTRKYFLWTFIATVVTFVLPLIAALIILPWFIRTITAAYGGLM